MKVKNFQMLNSRFISVIKTDANGEASVNNLDAQVTYYVKETKAPNGYSLNDFAYELQRPEQDEASVTSSTKNENNVTYTVQTYTYEKFKETKAPTGYKVKPENESFTIVANEEKEVDAGEITFKDTKLSALPSTGGIGTTIFTIAGCLIMVTAAGLFFASRKRTNK